MKIIFLAFLAINVYSQNLTIELTKFHKYKSDLYELHSEFLDYSELLGRSGGELQNAILNKVPDLYIITGSDIDKITMLIYIEKSFIAEENYFEFKKYRDSEYESIIKLLKSSKKDFSLQLEYASKSKLKENIRNAIDIIDEIMLELKSIM